MHAGSNTAQETEILRLKELARAEEERTSEWKQKYKMQSESFKENFAWPRQDSITAPYGDLRTYNGKKQSQHYGTDIRGATGTPVYAANAGTVVMSRDAYASGNTVLVHHGAGLYTAYFHLSAMDVKDGERVERGQLLGKVGATGRVTGPHLHWGVKVDDMWVDGETLLKLDFTGEPAPAVSQRYKE